MFPKLLKIWSILHPDGSGKLLKIEVWYLLFLFCMHLKHFYCQWCCLFTENMLAGGMVLRSTSWRKNGRQIFLCNKFFACYVFFPNGRLNHQCGRHYHHYQHHFLFLLLHHHHHHYCHQKYHHHHHHHHHHHPISILLPPCFHSGRRWWLTCGGHLSTSTWGNGRYTSHHQDFLFFFLGDSYKPSLAAGILGGGVPQGKLLWNVCLCV